MNTNPLAEFSRIPKLAIELPSHGVFSNDQTGMLAQPIKVKPMTGIDELYLKNPDALISGDAVVKVIKSCTGLEGISELPNVDIQALLLAIRYASYGKTMELELTCPECNGEFDVIADIEAMLDTIGTLEESYHTVLESGLKVHIRPHSYTSVQGVAMAAFTESKAMQLIGGLDNAAALARFDKSYNTMAELTVNTVINAILFIELPDGTKVSDRKNISEFIYDASKSEMKLVTDIIEKANGITYDGNLKLECTHCEHKFEQLLEINASNFFGKDSSN